MLSPNSHRWPHGLLPSTAAPVSPFAGRPLLAAPLFVGTWLGWLWQPPSAPASLEPPGTVGFWDATPFLPGAASQDIPNLFGDIHHPLGGLGGCGIDFITLNWGTPWSTQNLQGNSCSTPKVQMSCPSLLSSRDISLEFSQPQHFPLASLAAFWPLPS